jgi:hypothetical protein
VKEIALAGSFDHYWQAVCDCLRVKALDKSTAISLNDRPSSGFDGATLVATLCQALDDPSWFELSKRSKGNWAWRKAHLTYKTKSREVQLERSVVATGGLANWTFQMSTTSGLGGDGANRRRAIDLVQRLGSTSFRFIELKVKSDNPLYAAFEILAYGLAYCLARHHCCKVHSDINVLNASRIELEVLAPEGWYEFNHRGHTQRCRFDLSWLASAINAGFATEIKALRLDGLDEVSFSFRSFSSGDDTAAAASEIVGANAVQQR